MSRDAAKIRVRKLTEKETTIYVIGAPKGAKKIGLAKNPAARLRALQTGHGAALSVLYARPVAVGAASDVERRVHWLLRHGLAHGEWFKVSLAMAREAVDSAVADDGAGEKARSAVGRPSLNVEETKVRLTAGVKDRIIALVGKQRMAAFIREAVEEALSKAEKRKPRKEATEGTE